jgi:hypothetical protein
MENRRIIFSFSSFLALGHLRGLIVALSPISSTPVREGWRFLTVALSQRKGAVT